MGIGLIISEIGELLFFITVVAGMIVKRIKNKKHLAPYIFLTGFLLAYIVGVSGVIKYTSEEKIVARTELDELKEEIEYKNNQIRNKVREQLNNMTK